jgi:hypothetical protein
MAGTPNQPIKSKTFPKKKKYDGKMNKKHGK